MKTAKRLALAVVAAGITLTACSPAHTGAAAVIGDERITMSQLDDNVREAQAALSEDPQAKQQIEQAQSQGTSLPQLVLYRLAETVRFQRLAEQAGITVTEAEIDAFIAERGGADTIESSLLAAGVVPSHSRDYLRGMVAFTKLAAQRGGGTDDAARQRGQEFAQKELDAIEVVYNPRYGEFTPGQGFSPATRFVTVEEERSPAG